MRDRNETHADQRFPQKARRHVRADCNVGFPLQQCIGSIADHELDQLDVCMRTLNAEAVERSKHHAVRKNDFHRYSGFSFPAGRKPTRGRLDAARFVEQDAGAAVEKLPGRRQNGFSALNIECSYVEQRLDFLYRVGDRGLGFVQPLGRFGVAALIDHREKGFPLLERDARRTCHSSYRTVRLIRPIF